MEGLLHEIGLPYIINRPFSTVKAWSSPSTGIINSLSTFVKNAAVIGVITLFNALSVRAPKRWNA